MLQNGGQHDGRRVRSGVMLRTVLITLAISGAAFARGPDLHTPGTVKLALRDAPAGTVLEALAAVASLDVVLPPLDVTLTVHLQSASVAEALEAIADVSGVVIEVRGRIMVVFAPGRAPPPEEGRLRFERPAPPPARPQEIP